MGTFDKKLNKRPLRGHAWLLGAAGGLSMLLVASGAQAQTTYNLAGLADFTGPYADIMKDVTGCRRGVVDRWNAEVGKELGVSLKIKDYDTRYDVAQVASLWPGAKSELNPILVFGIGGPDAAHRNIKWHCSVSLVRKTVNVSYWLRNI